MVGEENGREVAHHNWHLPWPLANRTNLVSYYSKEISETEYDSWVAEMATYMETANNEDEVLVKGLNRGTGSGILPRGTLHPIEKNLWQFTKYLSRILS